jgi:hypothetical protein
MHLDARLEPESLQGISTPQPPARRPLAWVLLSIIAIGTVATAPTGPDCSSGANCPTCGLVSSQWQALEGASSSQSGQTVDSVRTDNGSHQSISPTTGDPDLQYY